MNRLTIIGNLTKDPETNTTNNGKTVCNFTVAVNRRQKRDQNGNQNSDHPEADFFRVAAWGRDGESCQKYLSKGRKVAVTGAVSVSTYTAQDGTTRAQMEIKFAEDVEFLSSKQDGNETGGSAPTQAAPAAAAPVAVPVDGDELPFDRGLAYP